MCESYWPSDQAIREIVGRTLAAKTRGDKVTDLRKELADVVQELEKKTGDLNSQLIEGIANGLIRKVKA